MQPEALKDWLVSVMTWLEQCATATKGQPLPPANLLSLRDVHQKTIKLVDDDHITG